MSVGPRVRSDGTRWVVTYHSHWSHNNTASDPIYNFVSPNGTFTPAVNPATTPAVPALRTWPFRARPTCSCGEQFAGQRQQLHRGSAHGRRRAFLTGHFTIAEAPGRQLRPTVGWDGTDFVVVWEDQRNQEAFFDERTDIYGARVDPGRRGARPVRVRHPRGRRATPPWRCSAAPTASVISRGRGSRPRARRWTPTAWARPCWVWRPCRALATACRPRALAAVLRQNVPNPFNPSTTILFALAKGEAASLTIHDLRGRLVCRLVDGEMLAAVLNMM